ncbi:hypothetical protein HFO21_25420 [Rhizobium laguerreae]|uniref:hypothetical protein n=1 Tax=Rhizobium laguerreae TaxID=1076926 RepID=UPI001C92330F|nr:hypothetical protein [Rhizobium laguerreae]MBY3217661.1 hypothetical protein [Rhizobium laguerreae]
MMFNNLRQFARAFRAAKDQFSRADSLNRIDFNSLAKQAERDELRNSVRWNKM